MAPHNCRCGKGMLHHINDGFCLWCGHEVKTFSRARWRTLLQLAGILLDPEHEPA